MKITLLPFNNHPTPLESLPINAIIGLLTEEDNKKYVLSRGPSNEVRFVDGKEYWANATSIDKLLERITLDDSNKTQLYYFTSLQQFASWLNS